MDLLISYLSLEEYTELKTAILTSLSVLILFAAASLARAEEGWTSLFDGKSLDGWI